MADFVEKTVNKSALRELTFPIPDVETFDEIVQSVIDDNPFGCVGYTTKAGQTIAPVIRNREHYTAKMDFIDGAGKRVGTVSLQFSSIVAFNLRRHHPPVLLMPGKDHHRIRTGKHPLDLPRQPRRRIRRRHGVDPGIVYPDFSTGSERRVAERLRRCVPCIVGVVDERPAEQGNL